MTPRAIPFADVRSLLPLARRTTLGRTGAAVVLIALALAAVLAGRHPEVRESTVLPKRSNGIVVLDLSASISTDTYARIGASLRELTESGGRYGLVVFSDTAYEAIPPGTPSEALRPLVRYFTLRPAQTEGFLPTFPVNPWTNSFSAGTKISTGLELARGVIIDEAAAGKPAVLLVSDLENDPADVPKVTSLALAYRREGIPLDIVALNPSPGDEQLYRRLVRGWGTYTPARLRGERSETASRGSFPLGLATIALAVALLLGAYELWSARLTWASRPQAEGVA
ncbi:MAG: vWA domain-containing protein [Actinomycetota bacterium]